MTCLCSAGGDEGEADEKALTKIHKNYSGWMLYGILCWRLQNFSEAEKAFRICVHDVSYRCS